MIIVLKPIGSIKLNRSIPAWQYLSNNEGYLWGLKLRYGKYTAMLKNLVLIPKKK